MRKQPLQTIFRVLLGLLLVGAGLSHLTFARTEFLAQVPSWVPVNADLVVVASGFVEISLGLALLVLTKDKVLVGSLTAIFFVLVFPGNVSQYVEGIDAFGLETDGARLARLFFQPVLVAWALLATGAWSALRKKISSTATRA